MTRRTLMSLIPSVLAVGAMKSAPKTTHLTWSKNARFSMCGLRIPPHASTTAKGEKCERCKNVIYAFREA